MQANTRLYCGNALLHYVGRLLHVVGRTFFYKHGTIASFQSGSATVTHFSTSTLSDTKFASLFLGSSGPVMMVEVASSSLDTMWDICSF